MTSELEVVLRSLIKLRDKLEDELTKMAKDMIRKSFDDFIQTVRKAAFYEAKTNKEEDRAKIHKIVAYLNDLYNKERNIGFTYVELIKRIEESTRVEKEFIEKIFNILLRFGAIAEIQRSEGKDRLYVLTSRIRKVSDSVLLRIIRGGRKKRQYMKKEKTEIEQKKEEINFSDILNTKTEKYVS